MKPLKPEKIYLFLFIIILCIGIGLRVYQYLMGRSLWEDEAHLALNFIYFGYKDLAKPLANFQTAPIMFLFTEETFTRLFGFGAMALRAFPLLMSLATLPLFYFIIRETTKNKLTALVGFLLFSVNLFTIYYSSETKPYIIDVDFYLLLIYLFFAADNFVARNRKMLLATAGCIAVLYSNAATIILVCIGCCIVLDWIKARKINRQDTYLMVAWSLTFCFIFFKFILHHPYAGGMRQLWASTFAPRNIFSKEFSDFIKLRIDDTFFTSLLYISKQYYFSYMLLVILIVAILHLVYRKSYKLLCITVLPVLLHLVASSFKLYPFYFRFILYLLPPMMILISTGTVVIADFLSKKTHNAIGFIFVLLCCGFYVSPSVKDFPYWNREIKPALNFINQHCNETKLYITTPMTLYEYYHRIHYAKNNNYERLEWNLTPQQFYNAVKNEKNGFIMLTSDSAFGYVDGYEQVFEDLKKRNLIVRQFDYKTYLVSEIKPIP